MFAAYRVTHHRSARTTGSSVTSYHSRSSSCEASPSTWKDAILLSATESEMDTAESTSESPGSAEPTRSDDTSAAATMRRLSPAVSSAPDVWAASFSAAYSLSLIHISEPTRQA